MKPDGQCNRCLHVPAQPTLGTRQSVRPGVSDEWTITRIGASSPVVEEGAPPCRGSPGPHWYRELGARDGDPSMVIVAPPVRSGVRDHPKRLNMVALAQIAYPDNRRTDQRTIKGGQGTRVRRKPCRKSGRR